MDQPIRSRVASKEYRKNWDAVFTRKPTILCRCGHTFLNHVGAKCLVTVQEDGFDNEPCDCEGFHG